MEWLKGKWSIVTRFFIGTAFSRSLFLYCVMGILGAAAADRVSQYICGAWGQVISRRYMGFEWTRNIRWYDVSKLVMPEEILLRALVFIQDYGIYAYFLGAMLLVIRIYHSQRVSPVLEAVTELVENVQKGDYYRPVSYQGDDELGKICSLADEIRKVLVHKDSSRQDAGEQQRRINAAFAHDIRTPLTVIRGYTEFLEKYLPQGKLTQAQVLEKLATIREQEERLFAFSGTMTVIQNMEKRETCLRRITVCEWMEIMEKTLEGLRKSTRLLLELQESDEEAGRTFLTADISLMLEALENIWNNALRYASKRVVTTVKREGMFLVCYIQDDGPGFSDRALLKASDAYFRENDDNGEHFGLGLTISRILCQIHGGGLTVVNSVAGGAIVTATFRV